DTSGDTVPPGSGQRFLRTASTRAVRSVDAIHARRFDGITRPYTDGDVERLRGSVRIAYTLADMGAKRLCELLHVADYLNDHGARRKHRKTGCGDGWRRSQGHRPLGMAGCGQHLDDAAIAWFQRELGAMGYKYQFVTLAGFHALKFSMFEMARDYARDGMAAY